MKSKIIIHQLFILVHALLFLPVLAGAQQKQKLTPKDYDLWDKSARINGAEVSEDGKWTCYLIKTEKVDSAFVRNINTGLQYSFSVPTGAVNYRPLFQEGISNFSTNSNWFAIADADTVRVLNLKSGKIKNFRGSNFNFIPNTDRLLVAGKNASMSLLEVYDLRSGDVHRFEKIVSYQLNKDVSRVAIVTEKEGSSQVHVLDLSGKITSRLITSEPHANFNGFIWNNSGNVVAFIGRPKQAQYNTAEHTLYLCNLSNGNSGLSSFKPATWISDSFQKKGTLSSLYLLADGKQLYFEVRETRYPKGGLAIGGDVSPKPVQIWGATALDYPPKEKMYNASYWYAWHSQGFLESLTNKDYPYAIVTPDQKNVMVYNSVSYLPQYKYVNTYVDIYLKNRQNDSVMLLLQKVKDNPSECMISPTGRYIAYFKQNNWWIYDFVRDSHTCLTTNMNIDWSSDKKNSTGILPPYGSPGWVENDQALIVFNRYDIWLLSPDGQTKKRITNGQPHNTTFRINENYPPPSGPGGSHSWFASRSYDSKKGLFITSQDYDNIENGWWWWTSDKGLEKIITKERKIDYLSKPVKGKPLVYTEQDFDLSPRLVLRHPSGKEELLYQTNPQQQNYYWGRSQVIRYRTIDGKDLSGALFFPANYDSTKKYPMVVEIYETRAKEVHFYVEPSESKNKSNYIINPTAYTADGYFVLLPDISYRLNEPGISAVRCITAAVQAAINKYAVDKNKIGLTGFSFGGYETSFTISQTNMFATAIAGGGITDVPDFYLGISSFGTNLTRVEEDQFRMNVPFYSETFIRNSPIHNIDKINTPLLLYTGHGDTNVDWTQSRRFQLALWRLGKKSTMLVYPGENHDIQQEIHQLDLGRKMKNWFDYYLKGDPPAEWIKLNMGVTGNDAFQIEPSFSAK
jgi:dipeptidyl aminopeptidase/acylaminoacyl peptidase